MPLVEGNGISDQDWRVVWQEVLDDAARRRVRGGVARGDPLQDPNEAAVAVEYAVRSRRAAKRAAAMNMLVGVLLLTLAFALVERPANWFFSSMVAVWGAVVLISPLVAWWRIRRLDEAIEANRSLAAGERPSKR